jgi:putative addiction module component (TIGR02574 family)
MSSSLEQLKVTLATRSAPERAELAHYLLETLEPAEEGVSEAWHAELTRRVADIPSGNVVGKSVEQVLARLRGG